MVMDHVPDAQEMATLGEPRQYDPNFKGPIVERECRDILFLLVFILFLIGMGIVAVIAYRIGNPNRILYGTDSDGNVCNSKNSDLRNGIDMRGKKFVFFGNPLKPFRDEICVKKCPVDNVNIFSLDYDRDNIYCLNGYTGSKPRTDILYMGCTGDCPCFPGYSSAPILRRCIPLPGSEDVTNSSDTTTIIDKINSNEVSQQILADLNAAKYIMLILAGASLVLAYFWLILLRYFASCLTWTTIFLVCTLSIVMSVFLCVEAKEARDEHKDAERKGVDTIETNAQYRTMTALAIIVTIATFVLLIVVLAFWSKIRLAVQIIKEACAALTAMPCLFCVPFWTFLAIGLFLAYWVATSLYLATSGEALYDPETGEFVTYKASKDVRRMQIYHLFGLFWVLAFLLGINETVIAGSVATWYFSHDHRVKGWPILRTFKRTLRYHLGSIAFGSLIIAIVQMIRVAIEYLRMQLRNGMAKFADGPIRKICECFLTCLSYLFMCLERFLRWVTRMAYIGIAVYGESFCSSARSSLKLMMRNAWRLIAIQAVGDFLINLAKITVTIIIGIAAILLLRDDYGEPLREGIELNFWAIPWILIVLMAWCVCTAIFGLLEMCIDTIFYCFCEDCERNDGSLEKPYYMSPELQRFTEAHERKQPDTDLGKEL